MVVAGATLTLGSLTTTAASGSLLVGESVSGSTATITTTTAPDATTGIYGGRVLYTSDGGTTDDFATGTGSGPYTFSAYSGYTTLPPSGATSSVNYQITTGNTVTLSASESANVLKLGSGSTLALGTYTLTINSGGLLIVGNSAISITGSGAPGLEAGTYLTGGYELVISNYNSAGLTISAIIGNNGANATAVTQQGSGTLNLSGTNTYSHGTYLTQGEIELGNAAALGTTAGTFTIDAGTTIDNSYGGSLTLNNYPQTWNGSYTFAGTNALNMGTGAVTLGGNLTITTTSNTLTEGGALSGAYNLIKAGSGALALNGVVGTSTGAVTVNAGTLTLAGTNTFTGGVTLNTGATLDINNATALGGSSGVFTINGGTIDNTSGGTVTLTNTNPEHWAGSFTFTGSNSLNLYTGAVTLLASPTVTVSANTLTVGGTVGGANNLTSAGSGTLVINGVVSINGLITNLAGTLTLAGANISLGWCDIKFRSHPGYQ